MATRDISERRFDEWNGETTDAACPECEGDLVTEGGETACTECGLLIDEYRFDHGATPRSFPDEETNHARTGAPLTPARHDRGLSSEIGYGTDANGHTLSASKRRRLARQRRHHAQARWQSKAEQNLAHACSDIARMVGALDLPKSIRKRAAQLYRQAQDENLIRGRSIESMSAASVYAACRCGGVIRTIEDVGTVAQCSADKVQNGYRVLNVELGLDAGLVHPKALIPKLVSDCDLPTEVRARALELVALAEEAGITNGRQPSGIAAACLYLAAEEAGCSVTKTRLAEEAGTSTMTIRTRCQELQADIVSP